MATLTFDTYQAVKRLQESGYTPQQAEGFVKVVQDIDLSGTVTKEDIQVLSKEIQEVKSDIFKFMIINNLALVGAVTAIVKLL